MLGGNMGGNGSMYNYGNGTSQPYQQQGGAVYGRITFNLDSESYNMDCGRLYELELERLRIELEQAKLIGAGRPVSAK